MKEPTVISASQFITDDWGQSSLQPPEKTVTRWDLDRKLGVLQMNSLINQHFAFHQVSANFNYDTIIHANNHAPKFGLAMVSSGKAIAEFKNHVRVESTVGSGVLTFNPVVEESHFFQAHKPIATNYFEINTDYFTRILFEQDFDCEGLKDLEEFKEKILKGEFAIYNTAVSAMHLRIVSDIINCPLRGQLASLMVEGSLQQLIAFQLSSIGMHLNANNRISGRDREIIYAVKEYLQATFHEDHSLINLSKQFGINQGKLKKYFKALFNVPVIEYVYNLKMEHARTLLYDQGMYVADVASSVGYKNPNHFATAFKRKFGVNPSRIRG